tara:strand:- start:3754 stop:4572 length:819 start_codon:yes stop_codon:yes gene_type:complete
MNLKVRGISYYFHIHQEKQALPYLILLHGFLGSSSIFDTIINDLKKYCNPITIDLLGHGNTEGAELHYRFSTKEQVADLSKLINEQIQNPVFLYGYSMGARLALQLAIHRSDLLSGLILESGTFGIEGETERQARQALDASRSDQIMGNFHGFLKEWKMKPLFSSTLSDEDLASVVKIQQNQNSTWMANCLLGFGTGTMPCVRERLAEIICPTQLIAGEKDSKFIRINQTMNKEISDSNLIIVKGSNHRVHLEQPQKCVEITQNFITKHQLL